VDKGLMSRMFGIRRTTLVRMRTQRWGEAKDGKNECAAADAWVDTDTEPDGGIDDWLFQVDAN
jgi:hypothetical protein